LKKTPKLQDSSEAIAMNCGTVADAFGVEDDLNAVTNELNMNIAQLEKVSQISLFLIHT
jgi:hypothetical protein